MKLPDILTKEEAEEYHSEWKKFKIHYGKKQEYLESEYNVHSGTPFISKVFRYKEMPIFRAHVFQNKLRQFDPYLISNKYVHPIWHLAHYLLVMEQIYHASKNLICDYSKLVAKDILKKFEIHKSVAWSKDKRMSIELILEQAGKRGVYERENAEFTFYNDRGNKRLARISLLVYLQPRSYVRDINKIRQGEKEATEPLIRKVERQAIHQKHLIKPREFQFTAEDLIQKLRAGEIPEQELHDFFSFWDKPIAG